MDCKKSEFSVYCVGFILGPVFGHVVQHLGGDVKVTGG